MSQDKSSPTWDLVEPKERSDLPAPAPDRPVVPMTPMDGGGGSVDVRRYLAAVLRYKWLILLLTIAGTAAGVLFARSLPEEYQAQATIWIESADRGDRGPIRTGELLRSNAWIELLRSYVVLDHVVRTERLYVTPHEAGDSTLFRTFSLVPGQRFAVGEYELRVGDGGDRYTLLSETGVVIEEGVPGSPIGEELGYSWDPPAQLLRPGTRAKFDVAVPRERAVQLNSQLQTRIDPDANFLRLELRMPTPQKAASVLNAITARYIEVAADLKRSRLDERTAILEEQLSYAEQTLSESEQELQSFKVNTVTLPSNNTIAVAPGLQMTQDPVMGRFFGMQVELEQLRRDRQAIDRALQDARDGTLSPSALEVIPAVGTSSELTSALTELTELRAQLRSALYTYTEEHPSVQRLEESIATLENATIPTVSRKLVSQLAARESALQSRIGSAGTELQQIPARAIEEARLERRVEIAERLYTNLQQRVEESRLAAASAIPDISILDEATVPRNPVRDEKPKIIFLALLGSLGLGVLGAILRERVDPTIRYATQVSEDLGLPVLGAVPFIRGNGSGTSAEQLAETTEAFRAIRLNLTHAHGAGPIMVTVSSPGPGDGKSFVAANLAVSLAGLGTRTLLIDGDIRRGTLHHMLDRPRTPGLSDHLAGSASLDSVVQSTSFEGLDLIGSGHRRKDGPELIDSKAMRQLLLHARTRYDAVLVDSAPLGAGVDPYVLGTLAGSMILVLRTGQTQQDLAEAKMELLERLPVRLLGAVLNAIRDSGSHPYYHYYSYLPGYEATDEIDDQSQELLQKG